MSEKEKTIPELKSFDFQKSDQELIEECRNILEELAKKLQAMVTRNLLVEMGVSNGQDGLAPRVTRYVVMKGLENFQAAPPPGMGQQQVQGR